MDEIEDAVTIMIRDGNLKWN